MANRFSVSTIFRGVDRMSRPISRMQNRLSRFTRRGVAQFDRLNKRVDKVIGSIKKMGAVATAGALGVAAAIREVALTGAEFDRQIGSAAAKFPEGIKRGTKAFQALRDAAMEVGGATEFSSTEAASGLNFLAKAGFTAEASMAALRPIVDFATASELDFATAADIASDALGALGLDSEDVEKKMQGLNKIMDLLALSSNKANFTVEEMFESIRKSGPLAVQAGVSLETYAATLSFLASAGIKASDAGTSTKNITLALAGVGGKAAKIFKRLGISLADDTGKLRDQFDVLDDLRTKLGELSEIKRVAVIEAIFGKIPIASVGILLGDTTGKLRRMREELEKAGGTSQRLATEIRADVKGSLDSLGSAIDSVKIKIFTMNEGPLKDAIDGMTELVKKNRDFIALKISEFVVKIINNFEKIVDTIKMIGKALIVFVIFSTVLKTLAAVLTIVNALMLANPIVLITLGVLALIAALGTLIFFWDEVIAGFKEMPLVIRLLTGPIFGWILLADLLIKNWGNVTLFFTDMIDSTVKKFEELKMKVTNIIEFIANFPQKIKQSLTKGVKARIEILQDPDKSLFEKAKALKLGTPLEKEDQKTFTDVGKSFLKITPFRTITSASTLSKKLAEFLAPKLGIGPEAQKPTQPPKVQEQLPQPITTVAREELVQRQEVEIKVKDEKDQLEVREVRKSGNNLKIMKTGTP